MILNNRKDNYDIKLSKRRVHGAGRCAARSGPEDGGGAHGPDTAQQETAGDGSEARHQDRGPGNPGGRAPRDYPGIQARAEEAPGRQRAPEGPHRRAGPPPLRRDANHLRRRLINRGLRAPSLHTSQRSSVRQQALGYKRASNWVSSELKGTGASVQALKPESASSRTMVPGQSITDR